MKIRFFYPYLTAYENLKILLKFYPELSQKRIDEVLEELELTKYKDEPVGKFSMGMKQRLGFGAANPAQTKTTYSGRTYKWIGHKRNSNKNSSYSESVYTKRRYDSDFQSYCRRNSAYMYKGRSYDGW